MILARVTLNGVEFEVDAPSNVYDGDLVDFNAAVNLALDAYKLAFPLDPVDVVSLEVCVSRVHNERAAHDGVGVEADHPYDDENLSDEELDELTSPDSEDE